jgi:hypothetical protein
VFDHVRGSFDWHELMSYHLLLCTKSTCDIGWYSHSHRSFSSVIHRTELQVRYALACREIPNTKDHLIANASAGQRGNQRLCLGSHDKLKHIGHWPYTTLFARRKAIRRLCYDAQLQSQR